MKFLKELLEDTDEDSKPQVLSQAGGFTVSVDDDELVTVMNRRGKVIMSVPLVIWRQLSRMS